MVSSEALNFGDFFFHNAVVKFGPLGPFHSDVLLNFFD